MTDNPDFALKLFNTLAVSTSSNLSSAEQKKIDEIIHACKDRQETLDKVIEIC